MHIKTNESKLKHTSITTGAPLRPLVPDALSLDAVAADRVLNETTHMNSTKLVVPLHLIS